MRFTINVSNDFKCKCTAFKGIAVYAEVRNTSFNNELWTEIEQFTDELQNSTVDEVREQKNIAATREAYKALGKDPSRYRPSAEALRRRIIRGLGLYRIDTLVDLVNLVSLRTGYSIGGFDADKIKGDTLVLGVGAAEDQFEGIGRGLLNIENLPVYRDEIGGIGTPTSDNERTKMDIDTKHILVLINGYAGDDGLMDAAEMTVDLLKKYCEATKIEIVRYE